MSKSKGYTLIELVVAVGLFALIMVLASGAYIVMIGVNRQAQSIATGINNLSFALESMTRSIRTGTTYNCGGLGDCRGANNFTLIDDTGAAVTYSIVGSGIQKNEGGVKSTLTDPSIVVSSLTFYALGTKTTSTGDYYQPQVTIVVSGTVSSGPGKTEPFTIETAATMRGSDI